MKILHNYIFSVLFLLIAVSAKGQQSVIVGYGETFESIANKYGIRISELRAANPGKEVCYAGMNLIVPQPTVSPVGNSEISSPVLWLADSLLLEAKSLNISGNNKKAIKLYNKVLEMKVRNPYAYAGRGGCYFDLKKFKKAKDDLMHAINSDQLSPIERDWCEEALEDVEKEIEAKRERKSRIWGAIGLTFAAAAAVTASAYVESEQAKMQNQYSQNTMPAHYGGGSGYSSNANQIIAQSNANINQMRAQGTAQLNQMTQSMYLQGEQFKKRLSEATIEEYKWRGQYENKNGYPPTEAEVIQWYNSHYPDLTNSYIMAKGQMYEKMHPEENNNDKNSDNSQSTDSKTDYSDKFKTRYSSGQQCTFCLGSGKCKTCNGNGSYYNPFDLSKKVLCPNCDNNHNGVCSHCHGTKVNP